MTTSETRDLRARAEKELEERQNQRIINLNEVSREELRELHLRLLELEFREKDLESTRQKLQEANRIKTELMGILSHDLGNPLNIILGNLQLLELKYKATLPPPCLEKMKIIRDSVERMNRLRNDALDLVRMEANSLDLEIAEGDLAVFLTGVVQDFQVLVREKNQTLICTSPDSLMASYGPRRLRQALENIISNAIRYTQKGGAIELGVRKKGEEVVIWVKDNGRGLEKKDLEKIFDPFYRAGTKVKGSTGLGLTIVKGIVSAHGGRCWAESSGPGKGSTFYLALPGNLGNSGS